MATKKIHLYLQSRASFNRCTCTSHFSATHACPISILRKSLLNSLPIHNVPNRTEVFGLSVLVLQIVRMLPGVDTQQRCVFAHDWVLVGVSSDLYLTRFVVLHQPGPSTALNTSQSSIELGLERGEVAVRIFNRGL